MCVECKKKLRLIDINKKSSQTHTCCFVLKSVNEFVCFSLCFEIILK